jgi:hypothetical protein
VDTVAFSRISVVPKFLVVQLERFAVTAKGWEWVKLKDRFDFDRTVDLKSLLEEPSPVFHLTGIVIHSGTLQGCHYMSYILIRGTWVCFNDAQVTEVSEETVFENAFGGATSIFQHIDCRPCAYLLFYRRDDVREDDPDPVLHLDRDAALRREIEAENEEFGELQTMFGGPIRDAVLASDDLEMLVAFYLNIFSHSAHRSMAQQFAARVIAITEANSAASAVMSKFSENLGKICEIFVHAGDDEIVDSFSVVIGFLIRNLPLSETEKFATGIFEYLLTVRANWRRLPAFLGVVGAFCCQHRG